MTDNERINLVPYMVASKLHQCGLNPIHLYQVLYTAKSRQLCTEFFVKHNSEIDIYLENRCSDNSTMIYQCAIEGFPRGDYSCIIDDKLTFRFWR